MGWAVSQATRAPNTAPSVFPDSSTGLTNLGL
jgi:hypothetical protein